MTAVPPYVCPDHRLDLAQAPDALTCPQGHTFPVRQGIPRFVSSAGYAEAFGVQWNRFRRTQLDSTTGLELSERRALRCLGLPTDMLAEKAVLEVGCGAGRFTEVLLKHGAHVTSVDLSSAVEANADNFPAGDSHRVAQVDLRRLPFEPGQYDIVFCVGVVQATPDPDQSVRLLYKQVKAGGLLAFDQYAWSAATLTWLGPNAARQIVKRLPANWKLPAVERMVDLLLPLHRALRRHGRIVTRVSPVLSYYHVYPELSEELQREWAILDTHDATTDHYKRHGTVAHVRRLLERLGLEDVAVSPGGNGLEARGRRPLATASATAHDGSGRPARKRVAAP
jgi:SAM-dependent methyltransferase